MNGYVEAGYVVILGSLGTYAATLVGRERAARRRVRESSPSRPPASCPRPSDALRGARLRPSEPGPTSNPAPPGALSAGGTSAPGPEGTRPVAP
jgi:hypothetical protein